MKPKVIAVVGPTSSGKSALAVEIAKKFNGEVISADSRQVYKGLDIGTGKITKKEMKGVPHHLLDVANPAVRFTVSNFKDLADQAISDILARGKLPIICGGTGFYIDAVLKNMHLPEVPADQKLRDRLSKKTTAQLFQILQKIDPERSKKIDRFNKVRIIRSIEIAKKIGKLPPLKTAPKYDELLIGLNPEKEILKEKIYNRLIARIKQGMINEAKKLHAKGLSWKRMRELGLEYRALARHLSGEVSKEQMIEQLNFEINQYAKRQMQWWKRDKKIKWFQPEKTSKIDATVKKFFKTEL